ncbi:hypothetical protein [Paenibacillus apiarius]|uniref:hypothetical protein n=1 Tax=Paenibacillus apiarius TaxID=46240 RepID=UPI003B3A07A0
MLVQMRTLTGRVSAWLDECYERTKNERRKKYAEAFIDAGKYREAAAELAIADLRDKEATALGMMKRYQNGLKSLTEEINYLKLKARMEYGGGGL